MASPNGKPIFRVGACTLGPQACLAAVHFIGSGVTVPTEARGFRLARVADGTFGDEDASVTAARALVATLDKGDYAVAGKDFNDALKKLAPPDKLKTIWETLIMEVGALMKQVSVRKEPGAVFITCEFEKKTIDIKMSLDKAGKIQGFFFVPSPRGN